MKSKTPLKGTFSAQSPLKLTPAFLAIFPNNPQNPSGRTKFRPICTLYADL